MKVAKNMDSVFSNCTDDELMFDVLFDDDETIIEALVGSDKMNAITAQAMLEEGEDMVGENPDFDYQNDGDASYSEKDAEGTKEVKPEIGGEVGDGKEVSGKENSAEANAHDTKDEEEAIGLNDKQQTALESTDEGPLEDDDKAEREGEVPDTTVETEAYLDSLLGMLETGDPIEDSECPDDCDKRFGADAGIHDTEGKSTEVLGASIVGDANTDPIVDLDDQEQREGKAENKNTEGVKTQVVGAALEATDDSSEEEGDPGDESDEEAQNESFTIGDELLAMLEADEDPLEDSECPNDSDVRAGADAGVDDTEGVSTEVPGAANAGESKEDPIEDPECPNDSDVRAGADAGVDDTEGVSTHVIGAAMEADESYLDDMLDALDDEDDIISIANGEDVVPNSVKNNGTDDSQIKVGEAVTPDELVDDEDEKDIEAIDSEKVPEGSSDYDYDYSDDELIDAVISGIDV